MTDLAEALHRVTAERDRARDTAVRLEQECAQVKALAHSAIAAEAKAVEQVEAERDALRARVERVEALASTTQEALGAVGEHWRGRDFVDGRDAGDRCCAGDGSGGVCDEHREVE